MISRRSACHVATATVVALMTMLAPNVARAGAVTPGAATRRVAGAATQQPVVGADVRRSVSDSADVVAAVSKFHAALASGDSSAALALLADDVTILESGGVETKAQYRSGHINGDMAFARAVPSVRTVTGVRVRGDAAWVTSSSVTQGESNGRQINSAGAELMVLSREAGTWKIRAIHWSSRARRTP